MVYHVDRFKASDKQQLVITVLWGEMMLWVKLNIPCAKRKALELQLNLFSSLYPALATVHKSEFHYLGIIFLDFLFRMTHIRQHVHQ